jgi:exonuclease SbcC
MNSAEAELRTKLAGAAANIKEKSDELKKKRSILEETEKRVESALINSEKIVKQIEAFQKEISERSVSEKILHEKIIPLTALKQKSAEYSALIRKLEPADRQYRIACQNASRKEELQNRLSAENAETGNLKEKMNKISEENNSLKYDAADHEKQINVYGELKTQLKEQNSRVAASKSAFDMSVKTEEQNSQLKIEIEEKAKQIEFITRKKNAAEKFRENIKLLGPYISSRKARIIAMAATVNFQRMTGRAERILWENSPEQYLVSITSSAGKKRYNMLSGGEQVAVALSIRSALASEMTDCRFVIFDEPTINLDAEKKDALSVSLYDMLKNLEQALIVTHDSAFREMASCVIEL